MRFVIQSSLSYRTIVLITRPPGRPPAVSCSGAPCAYACLHAGRSHFKSFPHGTTPSRHVAEAPIAYVGASVLNTQSPPPSRCPDLHLVSRNELADRPRFFTQHYRGSTRSLERLRPAFAFYGKSGGMYLLPQVCARHLAVSAVQSHALMLACLARAIDAVGTGMCTCYLSKRAS